MIPEAEPFQRLRPRSAWLCVPSSFDFSIGPGEARHSSGFMAKGAQCSQVSPGQKSHSVWWLEIFKDTLSFGLGGMTGQEKEEEDIRQRRGIQGAWREAGMSSYFISFSFQECEGVKVNVKMAWGQARGLSGLAAKPEDLSSNPGPHMVEGQNRLQKIVLWYLLVHVCIHIPYTHNHIHKRCICTHTLSDT